MKGLILAGGSGTRLYPSTQAFSKHLIPVYDTPMIYYPMSILMRMGISEIVFITRSCDLEMYKSLFGYGEKIGIQIQYVIQDHALGIAHGIMIAEEYLKCEKFCLILGDNIFYIPSHSTILETENFNSGARIFGYNVNDPERYGVVEIKDGMAISIEEKPIKPKSNVAVIGIYLYDEKAYDYVKQLKPSNRGEYEITDLNNLYLKDNSLYIKVMDEECIWLDSGTSESLLESSNIIHGIEKRKNFKIACLEEIAIKKGFITADRVRHNISSISSKSEYMNYLRSVLSKM